METIQKISLRSVASVCYGLSEWDHYCTVHKLRTMCFGCFVGFYKLKIESNARHFIRWTVCIVRGSDRSLNVLFPFSNAWKDAEKKPWSLKIVECVLHELCFLPHCLCYLLNWVYFFGKMPHVRISAKHVQSCL